MKIKILQITAMIAFLGLFMACGDKKKEHKSVEIEKKKRLKIQPTGYEDMTEEEVEAEQKSVEQEAEPAPEERDF